MNRITTITLALLLACLTKVLPAVQPASAGPVTITAVATTMVFNVADESTLTVQIVGLTGTAGLQVQGTIDGSNWTTLYSYAVASPKVSVTMTAAGIYDVPVGGLVKVRLKPLYITTGAINVAASLGRGGVNTKATLATTPTP